MVTSSYEHSAESGSGYKVTPDAVEDKAVDIITVLDKDIDEADLLPQREAKISLGTGLASLFSGNLGVFMLCMSCGLVLAFLRYMGTCYIYEFTGEI